MTTNVKRPDRLWYGIAMIVGSVFLMSFQDAMMKHASTGMSLWQIYVLRSVLAIAAFVIFALLFRHRYDWRSIIDRWVMARSLFLVLMYVCIYAAIPLLSLSVVGAAFYTGPLFITLFSALLIREPVGARGWAAVGIGFVGVLIILRPGSEHFTTLALLPVLAGLFYALAAITTRAQCVHQAPLTLALALNIALLLAGTVASLALIVWRPSEATHSANPFLLSHWSQMGATEWAVIGLLTGLIVLIGVGLAKAYQSAPPVIVATFDYTYLVFAAFWSFAIFSDPPDTSTIAGMVLIAGAGLLASCGASNRPEGPPRLASAWPQSNCGKNHGKPHNREFPGILAPFQARQAQRSDDLNGHQTDKNKGYDF